MAEFGLTPSGFNQKRDPDIKADIEAAILAQFPQADLSDNSVISQFVGIFTTALSDIWEQVGNLYNSQRAKGAEGINLDDILDLIFLKRLNALPSKAVIGLRGSTGTFVAVGNVISNINNQDRYAIVNNTTITNVDIQSIILRIENVVDSTNYTVIINGGPYIINSGVGATEQSIAQQLVDVVNGDSGALAIAEKFNNLGSYILNSKGSALTVNFDINQEYFTPANYESEVKDALVATAGTLTVIETPVAGLTEAFNFEDAVPGRDTETDGEARLRRDESSQISGGGTLPAIVARMKDDVSGVTSVKGYENRDDVIDVDGRPPHSIQLVIIGGTDEDIGNQLWNTKGGGIQTFGNTFYDITDSNNDIQRMFWSRPTNVYIWVKCTLTLYDEETFPVDGATQVRDKIVEYGNSLKIGEDVIPQRFHGPIFDVPGIETILIEIGQTAGSGDPEPPYQTTTIEIGDSEKAVFENAKTTVNVL
jgi:hypothetical protein